MLDTGEGDSAPGRSPRIGRQKMFTVFLFVLLAFAMLGLFVLFLFGRMSKAKGELYAARREITRIRVRHDEAAKAAMRAEARCRELASHMQSALSNTNQALDVAQHVEMVEGLLREFIDFVTQPELDKPAARHAVPVPDPRAIGRVPHVHIEHDPTASPVSVSNGTTVRYITD